MYVHELIKPAEPGDLISVDYYGQLYFGVLIENFHLFSGEPALRYLPLTNFVDTNKRVGNVAGNASYIKSVQAEYQNGIYKDRVRAYGSNLPRRICMISLECLEKDKLEMQLLQTVMNNIKREYKNYRTVNAV